MNYVDPIRSIDDIKQITKTLSPKFSLIWQIGVNIGLRVSDILGLNIKDVLGRDEIYIKEKKTKKIKIFPIKSELKKKICNYCKQLNFNQDETPLFLNESGKRLHRSAVYKAINEACKNLKIRENVGTHTMRKTFGYHHYKQFHDIALLQTIFNHSSPEITLRYIGITQEEINISYNNFTLDNSETEKYDIEKDIKALKKEIQELKQLILKYQGVGL